MTYPKSRFNVWKIKCGNIQMKQQKIKRIVKNSKEKPLFYALFRV